MVNPLVRRIKKLPTFRVYSFPPHEQTDFGLGDKSAQDKNEEMTRPTQHAITKVRQGDKLEVSRPVSLNAQGASRAL